MIGKGGVTINIGAWLRELGLGQHEAAETRSMKAARPLPRAAREPKKREAKARESYHGLRLNQRAGHG
jgi:hypothetical protein